MSNETDIHNAVTRAVDSAREELVDISLDIHSHPELNFEEPRAAKLLADTLEQHGFKVERGVGGVETAFRATIEGGKGDGPTVALLAEYDALPEIGHGCGHNLIAISNLGAASTFISILQEMGCRFALDDFGSGLSSFGYLKNLPVDYLKIDGMLVKDIVKDPIDHAMVKSINDIGHVMGMKTIAEFVENDEIKNMLIEIGVDYAQGYGIEKPAPLEDVISQFKK